MKKIRCPFCGEDNPEYLIIIEGGNVLQCDKCGNLFSKDTIPFQKTAPKEKYNIALSDYIYKLNIYKLIFIGLIAGIIVILIGLIMM